MFIPTRTQNNSAKDTVHDGTVGSADFQTSKFLEKFHMKVKFD